MDGCSDLLEEDGRYAMAADIIQDSIAGDNTEDLKLLHSINKNDVIVVSGNADHIEQVFTSIRLPHTLITPEQLSSYKLEPSNTLYMNCHPSGYTQQAKDNVKKFVADGGLLITTDYVLNMMLTELFPALLKYGGQSTGDKSVPIEIDDDPYDDVLKAFKGESAWKLAGGSHPITIVNNDQVKVLISSKALADEFNGNGAVLIRFQFLQGTVYHMISHFHLQRGVGGGNNALAEGNKATDYARKKGATAETIEKLEKMEVKDNVDYMAMQNMGVTTEMAYRAAMKQKKKNAK